jgi:hypothetical protein
MRSLPRIGPVSAPPGPNQPRLVSLWANDVGETKDAVSRFRDAIGITNCGPLASDS